MNEYVIYKITSPSGKSYIGQSKNIKQRLLMHKSDKSACRLIRNAIKRYGWENVQVDILKENLSIEQANESETYYINHYNTFVPFGYNLTSGGNNYIRSEETKQLMSKSCKGRKRNPLVVERINKNPIKIQKTADTHRGMKRSEEAKRNMSNARKKMIKEKGGPLNKGMKIYYNPNNFSEKKQCFPSDAPNGWINGNPNRKGSKPYIHKISKQIKWFKEEPDLSEWNAYNANKHWNGNKLEDI